MSSTPRRTLTMDQHSRPSQSASGSQRGNRQDERSSSSRTGAGLSQTAGQEEGITWSIHAADDDEDGSDSSASSEDMATIRQRRAQRFDPIATRRQEERRQRELQPHPPNQDRNAQIASRARRDLLPSPPLPPQRAAPSEELQRATASRVFPPRRAVTVNDIKNRTCWICSDGDLEEEGEDASRPKRRWVHPCKCTLVAHEDCLLQWVRSQRSTARDENKTIICPQCSQPYRLIENKPLALQLLEQGDKMLRESLPFLSTGLVGGSFLVLASAYGCVAIRLWMGKEAAARVLNKRWTWDHYVNIPLIPLALIISRKRSYESTAKWLPLLLAFPVFTSPFTAAAIALSPDPPQARRQWRMYHQRSQIHWLFSRTWPPNPILTIILMPWVRSLYLSFKRRITNKLLAPFARKSGNAGPGVPATGVALDPRPLPRRRGTARAVFGPDVPREGDYAYAWTMDVDGDGHVQELPAGAAAIDNDRNVYYTPMSFAGLVLSALSAPVIADMMGRLLARLAGKTYWLRRFLGIEDALGRRFDVGSAALATSSTAPSSSSWSASRPSRSPIGNIFANGSLHAITGKGFDSARSAMLADSDSHAAADEGLHGASPYSSDVAQRGTFFDDLDPVWFRNTVGAGLFVLAKDGIQLAYRYLRLQYARDHAKRTRIVDRPFEGSVIDGLDLRTPL